MSRMVREAIDMYLISHEETQREEVPRTESRTPVRRTARTRVRN